MILSKIKSFFAGKTAVRQEVDQESQQQGNKYAKSLDKALDSTSRSNLIPSLKGELLQLASTGVVEDISYLATSKFPVEVGVLLAADSSLLKVSCKDVASVECLVKFCSYAFDVSNQRALKHRGVGIKRAMITRLQSITSVDFEDTYIASSEP